MPSFGTQRNIKWTNFLICLGLSVGMWAGAYPGAVIGVTLGQPSFRLYMGFERPDGTANPSTQSLEGATSSLFLVGSLVGLVTGSYVLDRWGCKAAVIFSAAVSIFGAVMSAASQNIGWFITMRFISGIGSNAFVIAVPVLTTELSPPDLRGFFVGINGFMVGIGFTSASLMGLAFYYSNNPVWQWRGPFAIAAGLSILVLAIVIFVPESPRYLLMKGRREEAWKIIENLHGDSNDSEQTFVKEEFYQMETQIKLDRELKASWLEMLRVPSHRRRVLVTSSFAFVGQCTGVLVINNYGSTIYKTLGFGTRDQLILQCGWISGSLVGSSIGALLMDRVGRRPLMLFSIGGCGIMLCIESAMVALYAEQGTNKAGLAVAVTALYLFQIMYAIGVDVVGVVFYCEVFPNHLRAKGVAWSYVTIQLTDLVFTQVAPTAFANIGWKYNLVFIVLCALGFVWMWFIIPETKGLPLEELGKIFKDDQVQVYVSDLHIDHTTHEIIDEKRVPTQHVEHNGKSAVDAVSLK